MTKTELRKKYKHLRKTLAQEQIELYSLEIANKLLQLNIWNFNTYHLFLTIKTLNEVNTEYILNILFGKDKNIVVSKCNFSTLELTHYLFIDSTKLIVNSYGIPEPENGIKVNSKDIDVVFIPLLVFDNKGNRIGYGKGIYDRFLSNCNSNTLKIGLSFFEAENDIENKPKDIPLDYVVTPKTTYRFKNV